MRDCVSPIVEPPSFELLVSVISAKERVNRPSFNKPFALENEIHQQETIVSLFLAGRFFVVPEQVLGRTYTFAYEVASGFFCVWALPRAQDRKSPEATQCFCSTVQVHYIL